MERPRAEFNLAGGNDPHCSPLNPHFLFVALCRIGLQLGIMTRSAAKTDPGRRCWNARGYFTSCREPEEGEDVDHDIATAIGRGSAIPGISIKSRIISYRPYNGCCVLMA
jgi:hypothetical protein